MPAVPFTKGEGTGNDFVVIADPDGSLGLTDPQVAVLCDRRFGVGGDGILRVVRSAALAEGSEAAASGAKWFMDYRNADGSAAEMCGNGIRVFAHYLVQAGLAPRGELLIGTRAGVKTVTPHSTGWEADLGPARIEEGETLVRTRGAGPARPALGVDMGNPHVVVALPAEDDLAALDLAVAPHLDPAPEHGANVEFVVPHDPLVVDGVGRVRMRVFERGVGETLSCGTGVAAAAAAVRYWAGPAAPDRWQVDVPGGTLGVRFDADGHALLSGPATLVYTGEIDLV